MSTNANGSLPRTRSDHPAGGDIINAAGTMTSLGSSSVPSEVIDAMTHVLPRFVDILSLQEQASVVIREVTTAEAGCVTACAAAGIAVSTAACMTGTDLAKVEQLPETAGLRDEVVLQKAHSVWFGGRIAQMIRLSGAAPLEIGDATRCGIYQLKAALGERTAAALYVVSHHTTRVGEIDLGSFCRVAHQQGIPVIVDAASESNMRNFVQQGADLVCFSGHKFLAGPTSGIIAGKTELVRACLMNQLHGIGRAMKVGKEGIAGAMAALRRWGNLDHDAARTRQRAILERWIDDLRGLRGISLAVESDPTGNPIERLCVSVDATTAGLTASQLAGELYAGSPPIAVRDDEASDRGHFYLDPCNVADEQVVLVAQAIARILRLPDDVKQRIRSRRDPRPNAADDLLVRLQSWGRNG